MNIVFWALVLLAAFVLWFAGTQFFKYIGTFIVGVKEIIQESLTDDEESEE